MLGSRFSRYCLRHANISQLTGLRQYHWTRSATALLPQWKASQKTHFTVSTGPSTNLLMGFSTGSQDTEKIPEATIVGEENKPKNIKDMDNLDLLDDELDQEYTPPKKVETVDVLVEETEKATGPAVAHEFQAEVQKILSIVARSLYQEREVFVRELVSNGSDALEKLRHEELSGVDMCDADVPFEILISADEAKGTLTIQDTGLGMDREDMVELLGRIGHSGTAKFLEGLKAQKEQKGDAINSLIGQFGVGFYSCFMVSDEVRVYSKKYLPESKGHVWISNGSGAYTISEAEGVTRGTKIVMQLKSDAKEFSKKNRIADIIKKYSNFVGFNIKLNGRLVNTIKPVWTMSPSQVTSDMHREFYQFISKAYDEPRYTLHYATDSPLNIRSVFYIPETHLEKYGMSRMEPGVSVFSRKILIQQNAKNFMPDWMRFVRGVVDSEDLPLNISRETLQDSALVTKIGGIVTARVLKFLADQAKADEKKFNKFFEEFGNFLKEGLCTDVRYKEELARLLRMESSAVEGTTSLDDYISRKPTQVSPFLTLQEYIYYLCIPNREFALASPYYEPFKKKGIEVLFFYTQIDDFAMNNLGTYGGKRVMSIEEESQEEKLTKQKAAMEMQPLADWFKDTLKDKLAQVKLSTRLVDSPAVIVDHESAAFRRMMKYVDPQRAPQLPKQVLEINPTHPLLLKLNTVRESNPAFAKVIAEQVLDNALVAAGLVDDARAMLTRLQVIMDKALEGPEKKE